MNATVHKIMYFKSNFQNKYPFILYKLGNFAFKRIHTAVLTWHQNISFEMVHRFCTNERKAELTFNPGGDII